MGPVLDSLSTCLQGIYQWSRSLPKCIPPSEDGNPAAIISSNCCARSHFYQTAQNDTFPVSKTPRDCSDHGTPTFHLQPPLIPIANTDRAHSIENWITVSKGLLTALLLLVHCMLQRRQQNTKDPLMTKARAIQR